MSSPVRAARLAVRQTLMEQRNFWRSPEYALFTFALPLFLLLLLGAANGGSYLPGHIRQIKVLVPSILAFGVIAAAYANLGAKMAVLRHDGVLKRIRTTPLPSGAYLTGLVVSTVVTSLAIAGCTALAGWLAFGTAPRLDGVFLLGCGLALGIVCFAALGLAVSSVIKSAESASPGRSPGRRVHPGQVRVSGGRPGSPAGLGRAGRSPGGVAVPAAARLTGAALVRGGAALVGGGAALVRGGTVPAGC